MRRATVLPVVLLLAGCGGGLRPVELSGPAPTSASQVLDCVNRRAGEMGYEVVSTDQSRGTTTAIRRNEAPRLLRFIGFEDTADQITASVSGGQLRLTAISTDPEDPVAGGGGAVGGATREAQEDAQRILGACGTRG